MLSHDTATAAPRRASAPRREARVSLLQSRSDALTGTIGARAGMDGVDDLGVVDALQVDRGNAEVAIAELALDHDQRNALARHLDGVGVAQLVRREAPPHTGCDCGPAEIASCCGGDHLDRPSLR